MPRTKSLNPKRSFCIRLPEDLAARMLSDLWSDAEGCVPYGKWSEFVVECVREHYQRRTQPNVPAGESGGTTAGDEPAVSMRPADAAFEKK